MLKIPKQLGALLDLLCHLTWIIIREIHYYSALRFTPVFMFCSLPLTNEQQQQTRSNTRVYMPSGQMVVEHSHMSGEVFNLYLHQNYLDFFSDMDDVVQASKYQSDADLLVACWMVSLL